MGYGGWVVQAEGTARAKDRCLRGDHVTTAGDLGGSELGMKSTFKFLSPEAEITWGCYNFLGPPEWVLYGQLTGFYVSHSPIRPVSGSIWPIRSIIDEKSLFPEVAWGVVGRVGGEISSQPGPLPALL